MCVPVCKYMFEYMMYACCCELTLRLCVYVCAGEKLCTRMYVRKRMRTYERVRVNTRVGWCSCVCIRRVARKCYSISTAQYPFLPNTLLLYCLCTPNDFYVWAKIRFDQTFLPSMNGLRPWRRSYAGN